MQNVNIFGKSTDSYFTDYYNYNMQNEDWEWGDPLLCAKYFQVIPYKRLNKILSEVVMKIGGDKYAGPGKYIKSSKPELQYMCDNFVQDFLNDIHIDWKKYFKGPAISCTMKEHIKDAVDNGKVEEYKKENPPQLEAGVYVVFMGEFNNPKEPDHCGIMVVKPDKSIDYADNSSSNVIEGIKGGIKIEQYHDTAKFQSSFGYKNFCYQKIDYN